MGIQILIPHNKHREFMLSTTIPAVVSVGLNLLLIPPFGFVGASIVSVLTEALVWFIQLYFSLPYLKEVPILESMAKIVCASAMMYGLLLSAKPFLHFSTYFKCSCVCSAWWPHLPSCYSSFESGRC